MLSTLFDCVTSFIYPSFCRNCNLLLSSSVALCDICLSSIRPIASKIIDITKKCSLQQYALGHYEGALKQLILLKFSSDRYASRQLGQLMAKQEILSRKRLDFIVPVPLHWSRYASRGFNQAYEIAQEIGLELSVPVHQIIKRVKRTPFQSTIALDARQENVKHAFALDATLVKKFSNAITGKNILIIDDLMTTGSTIRSVARALLPLKPASLTVLVAARTH